MVFPDDVRMVQLDSDTLALIGKVVEQQGKIVEANIRLLEHLSNPCVVINSDTASGMVDDLRKQLASPPKQLVNDGLYSVAELQAMDARDRAALGKFGTVERRKKTPAQPTDAAPCVEAQERKCQHELPPVEVEPGDLRSFLESAAKVSVEREPARCIIEDEDEL